MAQNQNEAWCLQQYPDGAVSPTCFTKTFVPVPRAGPGQVVIKTLYISVDPYLRMKLYPKKGDVEAKGEFAPFVVGKPLSSHILGEVIESNSPKLAVGDLVTTVGSWQTLVAVDADMAMKIPDTLPPSSYLNVTGLIGLSTYFPVVEIGSPKAGETVFVSGAGGAVGSLAGQLFKAFGCKVIGSTGSDNKVETLRSIGFDAAFNYKSQDTEKALDELAPKGIDIYWDNVGGPVLDAVLARMNHFGRIVACGGISQYDLFGSEKQYGIKNYMNIVTKAIKYQGFLAFDYIARQEECNRKLTHLIQEGKVKPLETVFEGMDKVPQAFIGLFAGENVGKMLIKVGEPSVPIKQQEERDEGVAAQVTGDAAAAAAGVVTLQKEINETRELIMLSKGRARDALEAVVKKLEQELKAKQAAAAAPSSSSSSQAAAGQSKPSTVTQPSTKTQSGPASGRVAYTAIDSFGWSPGDYNSKFVSVYVTLEGVGEVKDQVTCDFTKDSFDLKVHGLKGRNFRLFKDNLEKEIVPEESKIIVKKDRISVQLKKMKGEFGSYDTWMDLTAKRGKTADAKDPMGGIMDLMKNLYEEGDDTMRKTIGEAMMKASRGDKSTPGMPSFDDDSM